MAPAIKLHGSPDGHPEASNQRNNNPDTSNSISRLKLGADDWELSPTDEFDEATWMEILNVCLLLRPEANSCRVEARKASGSQHFVRRIIFDRDENANPWLIKLRSDYKLAHVGKLSASRLWSFYDEFHNMRLLRKQGIPVPLAHHVDRGETCGIPFLLMDYIHGYDAYEWSKYNYYSSTKHHTFLTHLALITFRLSQIQRLPQIGTIRWSRKGVMKLGGIGQKSKIYDSPREYYTDLAFDCVEHWFQTRGSMADVGCMIPEYFLHLMPHLCRSEATYPLANADVALHNLVVDANGKILAMIDVDFLATIPTPKINIPLRPETSLRDYDNEDPYPHTNNSSHGSLIEYVSTGRERWGTYRNLLRQLEMENKIKPSEQMLLSEEARGDMSTLLQGLMDFYWNGDMEKHLWWQRRFREIEKRLGLEGWLDPSQQGVRIDYREHMSMVYKRCEAELKEAHGNL